jgi:hypothetical protein
MKDGKNFSEMDFNLAALAEIELDGSHDVVLMAFRHAGEARQALAPYGQRGKRRRACRLALRL